MIQSASATFAMSSSRFPVVILFAKALLYKGAGLDLIEFARAWFTIRFRTRVSFRDNPFAISFSVNSWGMMSSNKTSTPMFAKWQAIPLPIIPEPITATLLILLLDILLITLPIYICFYFQ